MRERPFTTAAINALGTVRAVAPVDDLASMRRANSQRPMTDNGAAFV